MFTWPFILEVMGILVALLLWRAWIFRQDKPGIKDRLTAGILTGGFEEKIQGKKICKMTAAKASSDGREL